MSYAFSLADMRTYLSYLQKKQDILFDQAADGADENEMGEGNKNTDPNKKKETGEEDMENTDENNDTM